MDGVIRHCTYCGLRFRVFETDLGEIIEEGASLFSLYVEHSGSRFAGHAFYEDDICPACDQPLYEGLDLIAF